MVGEAVSGETVRVDEDSVRRFQADFSGRIIRSFDPEYDAVRELWNGLIDRRPAVIARCGGVADVVAAIHFAHDQRLRVAVRGGGHGVAGRALVDDGLVIDLSTMQGIRVDPAAQVVWAQGGVTYAELDRETQVFGLATTGGTVSETGIAGLTLGGGLGWLMGAYGLACDNLVAADVVTADGRVLTATETEHADLFWGLRGGGGNLGVVTAFAFQLHRVGPVLAGLVLWDMGQAREVLRFYREFCAMSPDDLTTYAALLDTHEPDGGSQPVVALIPVYSGPPEQGARFLEPLRKFGSPIADTIQPMAYCSAQRMLDESAPHGSLNYWKSHFVREFSDRLIETLLQKGSPRPSPMSAVLIEHLHGQAARISPTATAFSIRGEQYNVSPLAIWTDRDQNELQTRWARECAQALEPLSSGGVYVNYLGEDEGEAGVRAAYGANLARLQDVKRTYDPENVFRSNQNVTPARA
jgi:FAD/FMN-containing dehydrogenase